MSWRKESIAAAIGCLQNNVIQADGNVQLIINPTDDNIWFSITTDNPCRFFLTQRFYLFDKPG